MERPFVCHNHPFICLKFALIIPLINKKTPFIRNIGFTLIELVITLTVAGILMAVAAPSMWTFLGQNRLTSNTNELIADINLSRSEAIKRSATTGICPTAQGGSACVSGGDWINGWLVYYIDPATNASVTLRLHDPLSGKNTLTAAAINIVYLKDGTVSSGAGNYDLCDTKLHKFRRITISTTGRAALASLAADSC